MGRKRRRSLDRAPETGRREGGIPDERHEAGLPTGQFEAASGRHGPTFGSAAKSSANLFSQNAWYVSNKVAPAAARYTLAELVDLQLACADCFDASNRGEDESSVRAMFLRALAVKRSA
jgi:hypothetical protein